MLNAQVFIVKSVTSTKVQIKYYLIINILQKLINEHLMELCFWLFSADWRTHREQGIKQTNSSIVSRAQSTAWRVFEEPEDESGKGKKSTSILFEKL